MPVWLLVTIAAVTSVLVAIGLVALSRKSTDKPAAAGGQAPGVTTPSPDPAADTQDMKIGTTINVTEDGNSWTVTVNKVTYRTTGCGSGEFDISDPDKGDAYVLIDVTYQTITGLGSYNPFDWSVVDADGNEYDEVTPFSECKPELDSSNSLHGKRHGIAVIEVKKGVQHGQVIYAGRFGDDSSSWDF